MEDKEKKSEDFDNIFMQRWHGMIIGQQNTQIGENMYQMMVRGSLRNMRGAREGDESERERGVGYMRRETVLRNEVDAAAFLR